MQSPHPSYRTDIEFLRALAVLLVVAYHYFPAAVPGGYIGVDVFFVISGFLITGSLQGTRAGATAPLGWMLGFWARRVRRLWPNAMLVLAATALAGAVLMSEFSLRRLGSDVAWSALSAANWLQVIRSIDYLAWDESQRSTLMHFWSLAVEEQFYLAWPLVLWWLAPADGRPRRAAAVVLLAALSLAYCASLSRTDLTLAFFSTPARAWELLVGAGLALARWPARAAAAAPRPLAAAGLLGIGLSAAIFSEETVHPGIATLLPVLSTALVIAAAPAADARGGALGRVMALPLLQAVGARSYSIYLWHWPVLIVGALALGGRLTWVSTAALLLLALALAEVAYRTVETPARFAWAQAWRATTVIAWGVGVAVLMAALGLGLRATGATGLTDVLFGEPVRQAGAPAQGLPPMPQVRNDLPDVYRTGCHLGVPQTTQPDCTAGDPQGTADLVLFGDSHAAQWFSPLDALARAHGVRLHSWTKSSCASVDAPAWNPAARAPYPTCDGWREDALRRIEQMRPRWVVLSNVVEWVPVVADPATGRPLRGRDALEAWRAGLERVIVRLKKAGIVVIVIRDTPRPRPDVLDCLYGQPQAARCELTLAEAMARPALDAEAARRGGAVLWDLSAEICPGGRCPVFDAQHGHVVYRDRDHISDRQARALVGALEARWAALAPARPR